MDSINAFYLDPAVQRKIRAQLRAKGTLPAVALGQFLTPHALERTGRACARGWTHTRIPDQNSYATRARLAVQDEIARFARSVAGKRPVPEGTRRFAHRDYTLLHDTLVQKRGTLALLFLEDFPHEAGGSIVFMRDGEMLGRFTPQRNTLLLVERTKGVRSFIHYVNHKAGKRTFTILSA
jgi:hypothetical protein